MEFFRSQKQVLLTIFSNPAYFALFSIIFTGLLILLFWASQFLFFDPVFAFHIPTSMGYSFVLIFVLSFLTALVVSIAVFQISNIRKGNKKTGMGIIGSLCGIGSGICVSCSSIGFSIVTIFGSVSASFLSFMYIYENPIRLIAIGLLILTYFFSVKNIRNECNMKYESSKI